MDRGLVFNIQRYCLHDGPGIRTTVFLKGCPLSCSWCHNPESQSRQNDIRVLESRCARCGHCIEACPQGGRPEDLLRIGNVAQESPTDMPQATIDCTLCAACVDACPTGARQLAGRDLSVSEVVQEVLRDQVFHDQSGGGATISGGEPLSQAAFVLQLLQALRRQSIHTALDTCGFAPQQVLLDVAPWVDLFLYDLKSMDDAAHQAHTGTSNSLIIENLMALSTVHANIWIRVPLISGFNMDDAQLRQTARFVASLPGVRQVNLLPYHRMGTGKDAGNGRSVQIGNRPSAGKPMALDDPGRTEHDAAEDASDLLKVDGRLAAHVATDDDVSAPLPGDEPTQEQIDHALRLFRAEGLHTLVGG